MLAHIVVFAFNRPDHLQRTMSALAANTLAAESSITVFCDGPRSAAEKERTDAVLQVAYNIKGFLSVEVVARDRNLGCGAAIIDGLQRMFARNERLIIVEDDILCSQHTLTYLNAGLEFYSNDKRIFSISAWSPPPNIFTIPSDYLYDVYAVPRFNCWGWASWRDRFFNLDWSILDYRQFKSSPQARKSFDAGGDDMCHMLDLVMAGRLDTWDIRADYGRFKKGQIGINPVRSYTTNIGMGSGVHCLEETTQYDNDITLAKANCAFVADIDCDAELVQAYRAVYAIQGSRFYHKVRDMLGRNTPRFIKRIIHACLHN